MVSNIGDFVFNFIKFGLCNKVVKNCLNFIKGINEVI